MHKARIRNSGVITMITQEVGRCQRLSNRSQAPTASGASPSVGETMDCFFIARIGSLSGMTHHTLGKTDTRYPVFSPARPKRKTMRAPQSFGYDNRDLARAEPRSFDKISFAMSAIRPKRGRLNSVETGPPTAPPEDAKESQFSERGAVRNRVADIPRLRHLLRTLVHPAASGLARSIVNIGGGPAESRRASSHGNTIDSVRPEF